MPERTFWARLAAADAHGGVESGSIHSPSTSGLAAGHTVHTRVSAYPASVGVVSLTGASTSSLASNSSYSCASMDTPSDCLSLANLSCNWCCGSTNNGPSACLNATTAPGAQSSTCWSLITNATGIENRIRSVDAFVHSGSIALIVYGVLHVAALCLLVASCVFRRRRRARASQIDPYHYWKEKDTLWDPNSAVSASSRLVFSPRTLEIYDSLLPGTIYLQVVGYAAVTLFLFAKSPSEDITCYKQTDLYNLYNRAFWAPLGILIFLCIYGTFSSYSQSANFGMYNVDTIMSEPEFLEYARKLTNINSGPNGLLPTLGIEVKCHGRNSEQLKTYFLDPSFPIRKKSRTPFELHHATVPFPYRSITDASTIPNSLTISSSACAGFSPLLVVEIVPDIAFADAPSRDAFRGLLEESSEVHASCPAGVCILKPVLDIHVPYRRVAVWRTSTRPRLVLSKAFRAITAVLQLGFIVHALFSAATWRGKFSLVK
ncbi:hypothetical protein HK405_012589, partial [Cladochytrium tenue]